MNALRARWRGLWRQFYTAGMLNQEAIAVLRNEMEKQRVRVFAFNGKPGEPPNAEGWDAAPCGSSMAFPGARCR